MDPRLTDLYDLVHLDPAQHRELTEEEKIRARAHLDRVIDEPPAAREPKRSRRRIALVGALTAGLSAAALVSGITLVGGTTAAYADWTPKPSSVTAAQALKQAQGCRDEALEGARYFSDKDVDLPPKAVKASDIMVAERRGRGTAILVRDGKGSATLCEGVDDAYAASSGFREAGSSSFPRLKHGAVQVIFLDSGQRASTGVKSGSGGDPDVYTHMAGRVGSDVTGIDVNIGAGDQVEATISNGWFLAWWPTNDSLKTYFVVHHQDGTTTTQR